MNKKENYWSRFAADFEERNNYVVGKADIDLSLKKVATLEKLGHTLELGCGNGTYSRILAPNAATLLATDLSDEMVEVTKIRLKAFNNVKVEQADCFHLRYPDNSFDTVFMANLIHIVPAPEKAIGECKRVLKKDGALVVLSYTQQGMTFCHKIGLIYRYFKTYGKPPQGGRNFGLEDAADLLKSYQFDITGAKLIGKKTKAFFIKAKNK